MTDLPLRLEFASQPLPAIAVIHTADLVRALRQGVDDFLERPSHVVFLCIIYPIVGLVLARLTVGQNLLPLLFPLAAGFTLVGPFAAIGLYELSRRRELGLDGAYWRAFDVLKAPAIRSIGLLGAILCAITLTWLYAAQLIAAATIGDAPATFGDFARAVFTTPGGWAMVVIGNAVGFCFAALVLTISVFAFPMLLDRNVDLVTAVRTSIHAVVVNPGVMVLWGLMVAGILAMGSLPMLIGLAIALPILGHATWHLYRKTVGV